MNKIGCLGLLAVLLAACNGNADRQARGAEMEFDGTDSVTAVQHMRDYHYRDTVRWGGKLYAYDIVRQAVDSLGIVTDENGERYADNSIRLTVTSDGEPYFSHCFVKRDFAAYLDGGFRAHAILDGMAFAAVKPGGVCFAVGVSYPLSDMSMPFLVTVNGSGTYSIEKDEVLDNVVETLDTASVDGTAAR
jgi:lipoprotein